MKFLRKSQLWEQHFKIRKLCLEFNIENSILNSDGSLDVDQDVNLLNKNLLKIPFQFNIVNGSFICSNNKLKSLKNCPKIVNSFFYFDCNRIKSLKYSPSRVGSDFMGSNNKLKYIGENSINSSGFIDISYNLLTSLKNVNPNFTYLYCSDNKINTLDGFPELSENINFSNNPIYDIYTLFNDMSKMELLKYYDIIYEKSINLYKLTGFLEEIGKPYEGDLEKYLKEKKWKISK
jgi:hypothetical protein